jgi:hypothetical protein
MIRQLLFLLSIIIVSCSSNEIVDHEKTTIKTENSIGNKNPSTILKMDTINTDNFWALIDSAVNISNGSDELKEKYLTAELEKLSLEEIKSFEIAFRKCIIDADDYKVMASQKIIEDYVSDDTYLYFRCWLIGKGKTVYTETLKDPDYLSLIVNKGQICDWEGIMYVATSAYSKKTGKEEDETFPRDFAMSMGLDYDFGAPPTKGTDWTEDQLPVLLPKLWKKIK